jgi:hypothetical protein
LLAHTPYAICSKKDLTFALYGAVTSAHNSHEESMLLASIYEAVLPYHFWNEIMNKEAALVAPGTRLVFPLPQFELSLRQLCREMIRCER